MIQATRDLALEAVRVTEAAAMAAARFMGGGDEKAADEAAVDAMHTALRALPIAGTIRIGEDDGAAKLYRGEPVGDGEGAKADVAVLPLEGATIIARGGPNALSVIVIAEDGGFVDVPATYMDKIAVGSGLPLGVVDLDEEPAANLEALAGAKGVEVADLVTCILDRPRHAELIAKVRAAGRAHPADSGRRRERRSRHLPGGRRGRLSRRRRGRGRGACRLGAALYGWPDAGTVRPAHR